MKKIFFPLVLIMIVVLYICLPGCKKKPINTPKLASSLIASALPQLSKGQALEIADVFPKGDSFSREPIKEITVMFNQPMVPLSEPQKEKKNILKIDPPTEGTLQWIGSASAVFTPAKPLAPGREYKIVIPAGTAALSGQTLKTDYSWNFVSLRPGINNVIPQNGETSVPASSSILVNMNQKVEIDELADYFKVKQKTSGGNTEELSFTLKSLQSAEQIKESVYHGFFDKHSFGEEESSNNPLKWDPESIIVITPNSPFEKNALIQLEISPELNFSGGLKMNKGYSSEFRSEKEFKVIPPVSKSPIEPGNPFNVNFSNPVTMKNLAENIKIYRITGKKKEDVQVSDYYKDDISQDIMHSFFLDFKPASRYEAVISSELTDINGNKLGKEAVLPFSIADSPPEVAMPEGNGIIEAVSNRLYPIKARNLSELQIAAAFLPKEKVAFYSQDPSLAGSENSNLPFGLSRSLPVKAPLNEFKTLGVPLGELLGGKTGFAILSTFSSTIDPHYALVQLTNLAIHAKFGVESGLVWVTSLDKGEPIAAASLEIRDLSGKVLFTGVTDKDGMAVVPGFSKLEEGRVISDSDSGRDPYWVFASKDNDNAFISTTWDWEVSLWNIGINYDSYWGHKKYDTALFTEKGIYSSGQTAKIKGIIRYKSGTAYTVPHTSDFLVKISNPQGEELLSRKINLSDTGGFDLDFRLNANAASGFYTASLFTAPDYYVDSATFYVSDYKPADFKTVVSVASPQFFQKDKFSGKVHGEWFFGAPMKGSDLKWTLTGAPESFSPPGYEDYSFGNTEELYGESESETKQFGGGSGKLNDAGDFVVNAEFSDIKSSLPYRLRLESEITSSSKETIAGRASALLHPADFYIGLKNNVFIVSKGDKVNFYAIVAEPTGKLLTNIPLKVEIMKRKWLSVRKETLGEGSSWVSEKKDEPVKTLSLKTSAKPSEITFVPETSGYYIVKVSSSDKKGNEAMSESSVYVSGSDYVGWARNDDDIIEMVKDKKSYKPGENAKILVKSPYEKAYALVTVENNAVVKKYVMKANGSTPVIDIPVSSEYAPGVFVSVVLLQGRASKQTGSSNRDPGKPSFRLGYVELPVDSSKKLLNIAIEADKEVYKPKEKVTVKLKLTGFDGQPVKGEITAAVVDAGVLSLVNHSFPDLYNIFYGAPSLFVESFDSRRNVIGDRNYGEKGKNDGGGGGLENALSERSNFVETAYWNPALKTDSNGEAEISFTAPDNLTTFTVMADAATLDRFSKYSKKDIIVNKPLIAKSALPLFINAGDTLKAGVTLTNMTKDTKNASVKLDVSGVRLEEPSATQSLVLPPGKDTTVYFKVSAAQTGKAVFSFVSSMEAEEDLLKVSVPVTRSETLKESVGFTNSTTDSSYKEKIVYPAQIYPGSLSVMMSVSSSLLENLRNSFEYLKSYPYGCLEQRVSSVMPYAVSPELVSYLGYDMNKGKASLNSVIKDFRNNLKEDGGFSLWSDMPASSDFVSIYALHLAALSPEKGAANPFVIYNGEVFLKKLLERSDKSVWKSASSENSRLFLKAYALYVLSLAGKPNDTAFNLLTEQYDKLDLQSKALLLSVMARENKTGNLREKLRSSLIASFKEEGSISTLAAAVTPSYEIYSSDIRTTAMALEALVLDSKDSVRTQKIAQGLIERMNNGRWSNTQDNAWALSAIAIYFKIIENNSFKSLPVTLIFDGNKLAFETIGPKEKNKTLQVKVPDNLLVNKKESEALFQKIASGRLYGSLRMEYALSGNVPAYDRGMTVMKKVEPYDRIASKDALSLGELYKVTISVISPVDRTNVVLHDAVPSGFKILDENLATESAVKGEYISEVRMKHMKAAGWKTFEHTEYHKDKVLAFATHLKKGEHLFTYVVRAQVPGTFVMAPAKAFMMYHPEVSGSTNLMSVTIK